MGLFNQVGAMGQPGLNDSYRSPYSTLGNSVFDRQFTNKWANNYAPFNPIGDYLNQYGWKNSEARDQYQKNPWGNVPRNKGGGMTAADYIMQHNLDIRDPRDWKKLHTAISQYASGYNPTGKRKNPFNPTIYASGPGSIRNMTLDMPKSMVSAYGRARYGYDNGLRTPYGDTPVSKPTGLVQNPEWDEVTGGQANHWSDRW